jgi:CheY-like chemotaxis protein
MPSVAPRTVLEHHVLVVDDHDDIRDAMALVLELEGCAVAPSCGVEDAFRRVQQGFRPCVVLLDLHMPDLDGWAFLKRTRHEPNLADVPVVIVSGDASAAGGDRRWPRLRHEALPLGDADGGDRAAVSPPSRGVAASHRRD